MDNAFLNEYPAPIARVYRKVLNTMDDPASQYYNLANLFEVTLKYAACIGIGQYRHNSSPSNEVKQAIQKLLRPSLGDWCDLLEKTLRVNIKEDGKAGSIIPNLYFEKTSVYPNIARACNYLQQHTTGKQSNRESIRIQHFILEMIRYRNRTRGHGAPQPEQCQESNEILCPALKELLLFFSVFKDNKLVNIEKTEIIGDGKAKHHLLGFTGQISLRLPPFISDIEAALEPKQLYLWDSKSDKPIFSLHPFIITYGEKIFVLNAAVGAATQSRMHGNDVDYLCYDTGEHYSPDRLYESLKSTFEKLLDLPKKRQGKITETAESIDDNQAHIPVEESSDDKNIDKHRIPESNVTARQTTKTILPANGRQRIGTSARLRIKILLIAALLATILISAFAINRYLGNDKQTIYNTAETEHEAHAEEETISMDGKSIATSDELRKTNNRENRAVLEETQIKPVEIASNEVETNSEAPGITMAAKSQIQDKPKWITGSDSYEEHITGFGSAYGIGPEMQQIAESNARFDASRKIVAELEKRISSIKDTHRLKYLQHLSSITGSSTSLKLDGLKLEFYIDNEASMTHAFVHANKAILGSLYLERKLDLLKRIKQIKEVAQQSERNSTFRESAAKYLSLYPLYEELKEAETILLVVDSSIRIEEAFYGLKQDTSHMLNNGLRMSYDSVGSKIDVLLNPSLKTIEDIARSVIIQLPMQVSDIGGKFMVMPFTYQDTRMTSSFARYFRTALEIQLDEVTGERGKPVMRNRGFKPKTRETTSELARLSGAQLLLSGTYWELDDRIQVMANLRDVETGKIRAVAEVLFDKAIIDKIGLELKPGNYQQVIEEKDLFSQIEIGTKGLNNNLKVDVLTNKGRDNLLFVKDEIMQVYIRVNKPAYVRLFSRLVDGRYTLLPMKIDTTDIPNGYYIDSPKANRLVEIPVEFECSPPFGAETLIAVARTSKFEPLELEEVGGYYFVKSKSPEDTVDKIRGWKPRLRETDDTEQSEDRLIITTTAAK